MTYIKLTAEEKQARKEARLEAKALEQFFDDLFWTVDEQATELVDCVVEEACYTLEEAKILVKLAYQVGKVAAS